MNSAYKCKGWYGLIKVQRAEIEGGEVGGWRGKIRAPSFALW